MSVYKQRVKTIGLALALVSLVTPALVQAQCIQSGNNWTCSGNVGTNTLTGSAATDIFTFLAGVTGQITLVSNGGGDTVDLSSYNSGIRVNLSNTAAFQTVAAGLQIFFRDFNSVGQTYTVNGGSGNDIIHGGSGNETINGGAGNDTLTGGNSAGTESLTGNDIIDGGDGNDFVFGGDGTDYVYGGSGNDDVQGYHGNDFVFGGDGDDILHGNNGIDVVMGGTGDDVLTGGIEIDILNGEDGTDSLSDTVDGCKGDILINIEIALVSCPIIPTPPPPTPTPPTPAPVVLAPLTPELCITDGTRVALDGSMLVVFSDFRDTPNGMIITRIPLASLYAPTDEEKASGAPIPVGYKDSEYAAGWGAAIYWQNSHYGVIVYKDDGKTVYDDTGAICGWF